MAEVYGFTPAEVGELTPWQLRAYLEDERGVREGEYQIKDAAARKRYTELVGDPFAKARAIGYRIE